MNEVHRSLGRLSRATVIRRLNELLDNGLIETIGKARSTRYRPIEASPLRVSIPIGIDAVDVDTYVSRPTQARSRVGYQRSFLDQYVPNITRYLPRAATDRLHQVGYLPDDASYGVDDVNSTRLSEKFLVDVSHASSALEGATTNYHQTERLIQLGDKALTKEDRKSVTLILNHKEALQFIQEGIRSRSFVPIGFNKHTITSVHSILMRGLMMDPEAEGRVRECQVDIGGSAYTPEGTPSEVTSALDRILATCEQIHDPFEQSFFALVHLPYLQAFEDGNRRTSRVMANIPLIKSDLCPISFLGTPEKSYVNGTLGLYELNRIEMLRNVYISTYTKTASHFHGEYDRTIAPDTTSFQYRDEIESGVRSVVSSGGDEPLVSVNEWVAKFDNLSLDEVDDMRYLLIEACRNLTEPMSNTLKIDPRSFKKWDSGRRTYQTELKVRGLRR